MKDNIIIHAVKVASDIFEKALGNILGTEDKIKLKKTIHKTSRKTTKKYKNKEINNGHGNLEL